jgi:hypothetical protein
LLLRPTKSAHGPNLLDALIETSPIAAEVLDDPDHTGRQNVDALG